MNAPSSTSDAPPADPQKTGSRAPWRWVLPASLCFLAFVGVLYAFAAHTRIGQDFVARQAERAFADQFEGGLRVESLQGNALGDLYARGTELVSPTGELVARVDSVVLTARLWSLFSRKLEFRQIDLYGLDLRFSRDSEGWVLARAFRSRRPTAQPSSDPWSLPSARVRLHGANLTVEDVKPAPPIVANGWLPDITNSRYTDIDGEVLVEWSPETRRLTFEDLQPVSSSLPIVSASGLLDLADGTRLFDVQIQTPSGTIAGDASFPDRTIRVEADLDQMPPAQFQQIISRIDLTAPLTLSGSVEGPVRDLVADRVLARLNGTDVRLDGRILVQDSTSITGRGQLDGFVRDWLRGVGLPSGPSWMDQFGTAQADFDGVWAFGPAASGGTRHHVAGVLETTTEQGEASGDVLFRSTSESVSYRVDGRVEALSMPWWNIGRVEGGAVAYSGIGTSASEAAGTGRLALARVQAGGVRFDSLRSPFALVSGRIDADATAQIGGGGLDGTLRIPFTSPVISADLELRRLNLDRLFDAETPPSQLNGRLSVDFDPRTSDGALALGLERSWIVLGDTLSLPSSLQRIDLARGERLTARGSLLDAEISGTLAIEQLQAALGRWTPALQRSADEILGKSLLASPAPPKLSTPPALADPVALSGRFVVKPPLLRSVGLGGDAVNVPAFRVAASDDRLAIDGRASSDSLRFGDVHLDAFAGQLRLDAPYADAPLSAADIEFNADSESAWLFGQQFAEVRLAANLDDSAGQLTLTSTRRNMSRALNLNARLLLLPDRNRFYVDDASLFAAGYTWTSAEATIIDVFADAVQTPGLTLDGYPSRAPTPERVQHLTLSGTLSERPADTLSAQITNVRLSEWAALMDLERPVRGIVDAQLAFTGGFNTPISVGTIRVDSLQYDRYDLGQLVVQSSYNAADAGRIRIDAQLDQPAPADSARTILDNEVRVAGTVRLPGLAEDRISDLDLTVEAERVDPFFFDYLFRAVSGTKGVLSGQVRMSGPFDDPAFEGAFALDGQFDLPAFGLQYAAEGNVDVQPDGLTLRDVQLSDGAGGTGEVDGRILFNDYRFFSFDLDGRLNELLVIDIEDAEDLLFYGRLAVSGTGTVTGPTFDALLRSSDAVTTPDSELFIPITVAEQLFDEAFITFADSTGAVPETPAPRENVLEQRPRTERSFVDGLSMNLNITAPPGSTVHLVFDPLLGDVVNAVGSGRVQFQKNRGEFATFGTFTVTSGDYLFTSQDIFARRFLLEPGGTLIWDGDPLDARLDLPASYRTRSSLAGLPVADPTQRVPLVVDMRLTNRVTAPLVDLSLRIDRDERSFIEVPAQLESLLNQSDRSAEFATSVLLTNSFLLTTNQAPDVQAAANQILFSSVSELVASQVNRFANAAFGLDLNFGVQQGRQEQLDLTYGFAVRLQDERLVIRGEGIYENNVNQTDDRLLGALVVEYQLSPSVSVEVFFRREDDFLETAASLDTSYGAGLVYQTEFVSWSEFRRRLFGGS